MRVMVILKGSKETEAGMMPDEKFLTAMGNFNEELVKAGVMLAGEGLHPTSRAKRLRLSGGKSTVIDGPFAETKEMIAGFWIWKVKSLDEAVERMKRCPTPTMPDGSIPDGEVDIRQVFEPEEFGPEFTPEARAQEERLRAQIEKQK